MLIWSSSWVHYAHCDIDFSFCVFSNRRMMVIVIPAGGGGFRFCPDRPWVPPSLLYNGYWVCFPGVRQPGRDDYPPPLTPRLKKE
jgi:hypothetical protein